MHLRADRHIQDSAENPTSAPICQEKTGHSTTALLTVSTAYDGRYCLPFTGKGGKGEDAGGPDDVVWPCDPSKRRVLVSASPQLTGACLFAAHYHTLTLNLTCTGFFPILSMAALQTLCAYTTRLKIPFRAVLDSSGCRRECKGVRNNYDQK